MKKYAILSVLAVMLSIVLVLCGCGSAAKVTKTQDAEKSVSAAPSKVALSDGTYLVRAGEEGTLAEGETLGDTYDLMFTTWNVGGFAAGVDNGIHTSATGYGAQDAVKAWKALLDYDNGYANHGLTSDVYLFQEFKSLFYQDDANVLAAPCTGETVYTDDVFGEIFANYDRWTDVMEGAWGAGDSGMGYASNRYAIRDVKQGALSGRGDGVKRGYIKGYIDVNGVEIALYSFHLGYDAGGDVVADSYYEIIELMNEDEFVIAGGDMNATTIHEFVEKAGYKAANRTQWGDLNTYVNASNAYIDNIFVSPNIDIKYVHTSSDSSVRAYSDHTPLTAYLTINPDAEGVKPVEHPVDEDGFTTEYK